MFKKMSARIILRTFLNIMLVLASLGVIGPLTFSAPSTAANVAGLVYIFLVFPLLIYWMNRKTIKKWFEDNKLT